MIMPIDPWATAECVCALAFFACTTRTQTARSPWVMACAGLAALVGMALFFTINLRTPFGGASCALFALSSAYYLHRQGDRGFFMWLWVSSAVFSLVLGFAGR
jgi:membrane associated rhomboid family serine protease